MKDLNKEIENSLNNINAYESLKKQDYEHRKLIRKLQKENRELKQQVKNNSVLDAVINRFLATHDYPNMDHKVNDIIELPSEEWKHADGTYCDSQYFLGFPDYFKKI
tara:strand:- start:332 stop:652 length:321 start_codon:yes stop_codon:yes gene_type:complete